MGLLIDLACAAVVVGPPLLVWGFWPWLCGVVGVAVFGLMALAGTLDRQPLKAHLGQDVMAAVMFGLPLWALGYGGWTLLIAAVVVSVVLLVVANALLEARKKHEFHQRYEQIQAEKRRRPDWTGKECVACGKPVPLSTGPGDRCPHCHIQFAREIRG